MTRLYNCEPLLARDLLYIRMELMANKPPTVQHYNILIQITLANKKCLIKIIQNCSMLLIVPDLSIA